MIQLFIFVHGLRVAEFVVKLILIGALVATYQSFLLNRTVLFLHVEEDALVSHLVQVVHIFQFVKLVTIYLVVIVLQKVDSTAVGEVYFLGLLRLGVDLQTHDLLLLVHHHGNQLYQLMTNCLILFAFYLWDLFLLDRNASLFNCTAYHHALFHFGLELMLVL